MELFLSSVISVLFVISPLEKSKIGRKSALAPCEDTTFLLSDPPWPQANRITSTMSGHKMLSCYSQDFGRNFRDPDLGSKSLR